jgi:pimeloyl-ACP methyl ester carboxylesterase
MKKTIVSTIVVTQILSTMICLPPVFAITGDVHTTPMRIVTQPPTLYKNIKIDDVDIFYREAGSINRPTIVLLHGFPSSSHMFRNLIPILAKNYHVIAPDYPGFGQSDAPSVTQFDYTFDHIAQIVDKFLAALNINKYSLYVMDYGAPIGFRIAAAYPEQVQAIVVQNGNAYDEGLNCDFWKPLKAYWADPSDQNAEPLKKFFEIDATKWQYTNGVKDLETISPDAWTIDQAYLDRRGNKEIQLAMFKSYGSNPAHYSEWQAYFRKKQPPVLIEWGKNDEIFPPEGAYPYKRDLKNLEFHLLDTGHFALEEYGPQIANDMLRFLNKNVIP